jgi:hypothetical protein
VNDMLTAPIGTNGFVGISFHFVERQDIDLAVGDNVTEWAKTGNDMALECITSVNG